MTHRRLNVLIVMLLLPFGSLMAMSHPAAIEHPAIDMSSTPSDGKGPNTLHRIIKADAAMDCPKDDDTPACLIEEAKDAAQGVENPYARADISARIVEAMLAQAVSSTAGSDGTELERNPVPFLDWAVASATGAVDVHERIMSILPLAIVLTRAGHARGPELFKSVVRLVEEEGPGSSPAAFLLGRESAKSEMLSRIARAQAFAGDIAGARTTAARQSTGLWHVKTLAAVAEELATYGDSILAPDFADEAATTLKSMTDRDAAETVVAEVASVLARVGRLTEALKLAAGPADVANRLSAHMNIARALADAGRIAEAEEALSRIEDTRVRDQPLWWIAKAKARVGDFEGADALLKEIRTPLARDQAIADVAGFQAVAGELDGALDRIADLPADFYRGRGLRVVVESLIDTGQLSQADEVLTGLGDDKLRRGLTVKMAGARARAGETKAALSIARAAQGPRTRAEALLAIVEALPTQ